MTGLWDSSTVGRPWADDRPVPLRATCLCPGINIYRVSIIKVQVTPLSSRDFDLAFCPNLSVVSWAPAPLLCEFPLFPRTGTLFRLDIFSRRILASHPFETGLGTDRWDRLPGQVISRRFKSRKQLGKYSQADTFPHAFPRWGDLDVEEEACSNVGKIN